MITKVCIMAIFMMIAVIPIAIAETEYRNIGGTETDFLQGDSAFTTGVVASFRNRGLTDGDHLPLISDLDGDGKNEIIILDDGTLKLYHNITLDVVDNIALPAGSGFAYSSPIIIDIDRDGYNEIIVADELRGNVTIHEYNGTSFHLQNEIMFTDIYGVTGSLGDQEILLGCSNRTGTGEVPSCLFASTKTQAGADKLFVKGFNATHRNTGSLEELASVSADSVCFPNIATISVDDTDADGRDEFVFSYMFFNSGSNEDLRVNWVDVTSSLNVTDEVGFSLSTNNPSTTASNCAANQGRYLTSPLVSNFDGGGTLETVVGYNVDPDEFRMRSISSSGSTLKLHPASVVLDGEILGNPMASNVFGDTNEGQDFCVFGQGLTDQVFALACGSLLTGYTVFGVPSNSVQFEFDMNGQFNFTNTYNNPSIITHMMQSDDLSVDVAEGATDTTELVTSHGVFRLSGDSSGFPEQKFEMDQVFTLTSERACVPVDYEQNTASDLICVNDNQLTYVNDNVFNGVGVISDIEYNPCISSVVSVNTSIQFGVTVVDQNDAPLPQDTVTSRVTLYEGTANEQISPAINSTSGSKVPHLFSFPGGGLNKTGTVNVKFEAWDVEHPSTIDVVTRTFTVANAGLAFGDCTETESLIVTAQEEAEDALTSALPTDQVDNSVTTAIQTVGGITGLGGVTLWFIVMFIVTLGIWTAVHESGLHGGAAMGTILIVNFLLILLGAQLGIFGVGIIFILVLLGVLVGAVFLSQFLFRNNSSG